ncbi:MAG: superoxide dismutase [Candidatus Zixiibacteriota bacterium]
MAYKLPKLQYSYDALEPYIDARTMEIHHSKHHQAYVNNLNAIVENYADIAKQSPEELLVNLNNIPEKIRTGIRNNGGGVANHTFFWSILKKGVEFSGEVSEAINAKYGSFDNFKEQFMKAALGQFGSGWAWLVVSNGDLEIMATANQDSPLNHGKTPILAVDVWEHAYYLNYQNRRPDYLNEFFNVINWEKVNKYYCESVKKSVVTP